MSKIGFIHSIKRKALTVIAKHYKTKKDYAMANVLYDKIISKERLNRDSELLLEHIYILYKLKDYENALNKANSLLENNELQVTKGHLNFLGNIYYKYIKNIYDEGEIQETINIIEKINYNYEITNYNLQILHAQALMTLRRYIEAEQVLQIASETKPNKPISHYLRGILCISQKRWYEAEISLLNAKELGYSTPKFYNRLGEAYFHMRRYEKAIKAYKNAANKWSDKTIAHVTIADIYYLIGLSYEKLNDYNNSVKFYKKAINNDHKYNSEILGIGFFHEKYKHFKLAAQSYAKINTDESIFKSAMIYEKMGDYKLAKKYYEKVLSKDRTNPQYHFRFAVFCENNGEYERAVKYYKSAIERKDNFTPDWYLKLISILNKIKDYNQLDKIINEAKIVVDYINSVYRNGNNKMSKNMRYNIFYTKNPIQKNTILFESMTGGRISGNPLALFKYMLNDKQFQNYTFIWSVNDYNLVPKEYMALENVIFVLRNTDSYYKYLTSAEYLVNDSAFPYFFIRKDGQKYLNTWHGTPWKTLGYDFESSKLGYANAARNFLQSTNLLIPNEYTFKQQIESHQIDTIYEGEIAVTGYPRIDMTITTMKNSTWLKSLLNITDDKKIILYAPTWRGNIQDGRSINIEKIESDLKKMSKVDAHIYFRGHYLIESLLKDLEIKNITTLPSTVDINEMLGIVDILITDYSSVFFDFLVTENQIIHYVYDFQDYMNHRGLYFGLDGLPGIVVNNINDLINEVKDLLNQNKPLTSTYYRAKKSYVYKDDGNVTRKTIDWFINNQSLNEVKEIINKKRKILFYAGSFQPNGITNAFINLIKSIDKDKYDITIILPDSIMYYKNRINLLNRIKDDVNIIPRTGIIFNTDKSLFYENLAYENPSKYVNSKIRKNNFQNEFGRLFNTVHFDYVIDYSSYSSYFNQLLLCHKNKEVKTIAFLHNDLYSEYKNRHSQLRIIFEQYKEYDKLISVSRPTSNLNKENLVSKFNISIDKFHFINNVQNPQSVINRSLEPLENSIDEILFGTDKITFVTMGRLSKEKDHEKLIKAFSKVYLQNKNIQLLILGDGPLKQNLLSLIEKYNLEMNIKLLGLQSNPYPYLKKSDCFILSSNYEGQPVVLYEALILEKPIIATDIIANHGVLGSDYGMLCENSVEGLEMAMMRFLEGEISSKYFDIKQFNERAIEMFYTKVL